MEDNIILGTRVSLTRNINSYPFPHKLSQSESQVIANKINNIILKSDDLFHENFITYNMNEISQIEKNILIERGIISNKFSVSDIGSIIINENKTKFITINDQDHIKISIYKDKFNVDEAFVMANQIDDILESKLDYAFDDKLGYLNSSLAKLGTGLKASVIAHLPILSLQRKIELYSGIANKLGLNIKGICNEKSNILGNMYDISTKSTIDKTEKNSIESLKSLTRDIITRENQSRIIVKIEASIELEDEIYRALGILQNSRIISPSEAMKHLSNIKLGIEMDYIKDISNERIINLMKGMKPDLMIMSKMTSDSDIKRANFLREEFKRVNKNKE